MYDAIDMARDRKIKELEAFEAEVMRQFAAGSIRGPVHLSGGNESELMYVFDDIAPTDWIFSTWRNHYHALLHGIPSDWLMAEIMAGRSMTLINQERNFYTSSIVGGTIPIAVGVASTLKSCAAPERVWCFIGDMTASLGVFQDALNYAEGFDLPITFVIEDNGLSTNTPTAETWGVDRRKPITSRKVKRYKYTRTYPHVGIGYKVAF